MHAYAPVSGGSYSGTGWTCTTQGVCAADTPVPAGGTLPPITITSTAPAGLTQANQPEADLTNTSDSDKRQRHLHHHLDYTLGGGVLHRICEVQLNTAGLSAVGRH